jgi:predicted secreted protein
MIPAIIAAATVSDVVYTNAANVIHVVAGELFLIALDANRTTGYSWSIAKLGGGTLQSVGTTYLPPRSGQLGAPGQQLLMFRAKHIGSGTVTVIYTRSFDPQTTTGAKRMTFNIVVGS